MNSQALSPGTLLHNGSYRIEGVIGQGGFGITYLATDVNIQTKVAIKEFFPKYMCERMEGSSHISLGTKNTADIINKLKIKFLKEARNLAKLSNDNIIKIITAFEQNSTAYYVMEYIEGSSLAEIVKENGKLPENAAIDYVIKIGQALQYIHDRHITHLDVKPANIMVRYSDDEPILIDFGLAKQYNSEGQQTSTTPVGVSHGFAPLEQYQSGGVAEFSPQTDVYSLAATLYFLLTGEIPLEAQSRANKDLYFPADFPRWLIPIVEKAMSMKVSDRQPSVSHFIDELGGETVIKNSHEPPRPIFPVKPKKSSGKKWIWLSAALLVAVGVCLLPFLIPTNPEEENLDIEEKNIESPRPKDFVITPEFARKVQQYDVIGGFSEGLIVVGISVGKDDYGFDIYKRGFIDENGDEAISLDFDEAYEFKAGLAPVKKDGKWGYIDKKGDYVIAPQFDSAMPFSEGRAVVGMSKNIRKEENIDDQLLLYEKNYGVIDSLGNFVVPPIYSKIDDFSEGLAAVELSGEGAGYINRNGEVVIGLNYNKTQSFSEGLAIVKDSDEVNYIIDRDDNIKFELDTYSWPRQFSEGLIEYRKNGYSGFKDKNGNVKIPAKFKIIDSNGFKEGLAAVEINGQYGYIESNGIEKIPPQFEWASYFSEGFAPVMKNGKYGYIDNAGVLRIGYKFDRYGYFNDGLALVTLYIGEIRLPNGDTRTKRIYGFVDKYGNSTFTDADYKLAEKYTEQKVKERNR